MKSLTIFLLIFSTICFGQDTLRTGDTHSSDVTFELGVHLSFLLGFPSQTSYGKMGFEAYKIGKKDRLIFGLVIDSGERPKDNIVNNYYSNDQRTTTTETFGHQHIVISAGYQLNDLLKIKNSPFYINARGLIDGMSSKISYDILSEHFDSTSMQWLNHYSGQLNSNGAPYNDDELLSSAYLNTAYYGAGAELNLGVRIDGSPFFAQVQFSPKFTYLLKGKSRITDWYSNTTLSTDYLKTVDKDKHLFQTTFFLDVMIGLKFG